MPLSIGTIIRLCVLIALATHVFYMYCLARTSTDTFGLNLGGFLVAAGFATIMLLPLSWAVAIVELPDMYTQHWRARFRWKHGRCARCAYPRSDEARSRLCPECGMTYAEPEPYRLNRDSIQRYMVLVAIAWLMGIGFAESWTSIDEMSFRREVQALQRSTGVDDVRYWRKRGWPSGTFLGHGDQGFTASRSMILQD